MCAREGRPRSVSPETAGGALALWPGKRAFSARPPRAQRRAPWVHVLCHRRPGRGLPGCTKEGGRASAGAESGRLAGSSAA
ncbi:unnamed protein product [Amoebophrya sp. A120]|nr:unnamed protein product [Amoebophrya sp. A120]|eukprot:GSA120T00002919001.1